MTPPDWIAAFDDMLTQRHKRCTLCGAPAVHGGIWDVGVHYVAFVFCRRHADQMTASEETLEALLAQRYATRKGGEP